ncbi:hypothetical protein PO587_43645 [Streptomyces gilvifuscus]|uniref:Uncharacterized protein n=1 Tax=Streptomyces gilvifuscus TaxID=1550617 RepID=A0ABT5G949_9ACTN|nr:hypothetical protein [Streptomyces gilvifuscus]MDC2961340.1 hypothetical protein [Streptomyces gilvifuscus]
MAQGEGRRGRPMKPIDPGLADTVAAWLRLWRSLVVEPLRAADPPWTLERMSAELARRMGSERLEGGARTDASGTAKPTLQRFFAGERVPARDVVQHLLDIACETLEPPPTREEMNALWAAHRAALHTSFPLLADLYDALDQRDAARRRAEHLQQAKDQLAEDLDLSQRQEQRLEVLLRHAGTELEHAQQTALIRDDEARRAQAETAELTARLGELEEQLRQSRQDQERLEQEIRSLCEQASTSTAHAQRITDLQNALDSVREENEELARLARTATLALHDAQQRIRSSNDTARREEHALPVQRSHGELERRHEVAMHAVAHLSEQLRTVSRDLADARAELLRRDGDLARLVEEHAEEIASLRADRVLAEADTVLSLALQHLDPAPAALPPASDVPAAETTDPPSAHVPSRPVPEVDPPPGKRTSPSQGERRPPDLGQATAPDASSPHPSRPVPDGNPLTATQESSGGPPRGSGLSGNAPYEQGIIVGAVVGILVAGFFVFVWAGGFPSDHGDARKPSPTAASRSASASASPLPQKPAKDPVADIGDQEVNTATVMKLPPCTNGDVRLSARSAHNAYGSGEKVRIKLTISAADSGTVPCRVDAARDRATLTLTAAAGESPLWDSSGCADEHAAHRWIEVARSRPAFVDFVWDRIPNDGNCRQKTHAAAGTYLVESTVLGKKTQTSFVLEADTATGERFSPSPSVEATGHADTTTGSSSASGGSIGGLFGGTDSQTPSEAPSSQNVSTTPSGANGGNGGGSNGSADAGLFGGST